MRPIIGIPLRYQCLSDGRAIIYMSERVRRTVQEAGGVVYPIAPVQDVDYFYTKGNEFLELSDDEKNMISKSLDYCDGVLLPGGNKFTPYDRYLLELVIEKRIPVLGICLGMQMMSCYQENIRLSKNAGDINHDQDLEEGFSHKVIIDANSRLYEILGVRELMVNSFHQYHATENGIYKTAAYSEDGLIEAIEYPSLVFNIGVQWHPEISYPFDEASKKIIAAFIEAASLKGSRKNIRICDKV